MQITLVAGAGGMVRPNAIAPILVILQNDDTERTGIVGVTFLNSKVSISEASRSVSLPPQSRKAIYLYLPATSAVPDQVHVRYISEQRYVVSETTEALKSAAPDLPVIAIVGPIPSGLPATLDEKGRTLSTRVFLTPDQLPDRWEGWQMFDAVIFSTAPERPLDSARQDALQDWVLRGGVWTIVADEKTDGLMALADADILPLKPRALEQCELPLFGGKTEVMTGTVVRATPLLESDGHPLVVRRNAGFGSVVCVMVSLEAPIITRWEGWGSIWQQALGHFNVSGNDPDSPDIPTAMPENRASNLIAAAKPYRQPAGRIVLVVLLSALYAVAVGPADYSLVKFLRKPYLTWVTFPAIVAVFTAGSWFGAKYLVGGELGARFVQRTLYAPGAGYAVHCGLTSLFVPATGDYVMADHTGGLLQPLQPFTDYWPVAKAVCFDIDQPATKDRVPIWNYRVYMASSTGEDPCPVELRVESENGAKSVSIMNKGKTALRNCWLCYGTRVWSIPGILAPGTETQTVLGEAESREFPGQLPGEYFVRMAHPGNMHLSHNPLTREMDARAALAHGGLLFVATLNTQATDTLNVNGAMLTGPCVERLEVIVYPEQDAL